MTTTQHHHPVTRRSIKFSRAHACPNNTASPSSETLKTPLAPLMLTSPKAPSKNSSSGIPGTARNAEAICFRTSQANSPALSCLPQSCQSHAPGKGCKKIFLYSPGTTLPVTVLSETDFHPSVSGTTFSCIVRRHRTPFTHASSIQTRCWNSS